MNLNLQFFLEKYDNPTPSWISSERYSYCENFYRFLSFFKKK